MKAIIDQKQQIKALLNIAFDSEAINDIKKCSYKEQDGKIIVNNAQLLEPLIRAKLTNIFLIAYPHYQIFFKENSLIWINVREYTKTHLTAGENVDKSWFAKLHSIQKDNKIILTNDSAFIISWIKNNYLHVIEEGFAIHDYILDQYLDDKSIHFVKK